MPATSRPACKPAGASGDRRCSSTRCAPSATGASATSPTCGWCSSSGLDATPTWSGSIPCTRCSRTTRSTPAPTARPAACSSTRSTSIPSASEIGKRRTASPHPRNCRRISARSAPPSRWTIEESPPPNCRCSSRSTPRFRERPRGRRQRRGARLSRVSGKRRSGIAAPCGVRGATGAFPPPGS